MSGKVFIKAENLCASMYVGEDIKNRLGQSLLVSGAVLTDSRIQSLIKKGYGGAYVSDSLEEKVEESKALVEHGEKDAYVGFDVAEEALKQIDTKTKDDPTAVTFNSQIKERISKGIEYIYNNVGTPEMNNAVQSITHDIIGAIDSNKAIAINLTEIKASDEYTFKHSVDVATIALILSRYRNASESQMHDIGIAALLHDIGKTRIPDCILNKPGKLTDAEFEVMKLHPQYSYEILKNTSSYNNAICSATLQHHEKMDGSGYPFGLKRKEIFGYAKLISVADIYDALVTDRAYKKAIPAGMAVEIMMAMGDELDIPSFKAFMQSVILYPSGSIVLLSNGEIATVVENIPAMPLRPTVVSLATGTVYNLSTDRNCSGIIIMDIIQNQPGQFS